MAYNFQWFGVFALGERGFFDGRRPLLIAQGKKGRIELVCFYTFSLF